jgi:hypothetical protein
VATAKSNAGRRHRARIAYQREPSRRHTSRTGLGSGFEEKDYREMRGAAGKICCFEFVSIMADFLEIGIEQLNQLSRKMPKQLYREVDSLQTKRIVFVIEQSGAGSSLISVQRRQESQNTLR